jgi:MFS family permease
VNLAALFSRDRIQASPGYHRLWVAPSALAIHLCIGQVYAFSVFNRPLEKVLGVSLGAGQPVPGDWTAREIGWIFTLAIVFLGLSAAVGGRWVQAAGPRASGTAAAVCWGLGFLVAAYGVHVHEIWLLYLGYGMLGGCGLGLGYITPVATLVQWFPDRRGFATGIAIMGFGGGSILAGPLSKWLMDHFATETSGGVAATFVVLGVAYLTVMLVGAFSFRLPPPGWTPPGWTPPARTLAAPGLGLTAGEAMKTLPFWLLWVVLFVNVTAGIGILAQAAPMAHDMFPETFDETAPVFVAMLSFFNMVGRFLWSSASDWMGRKWTYAIFFVLGTLLYAAVPLTGRLGSAAMFCVATAVLMTMYGGGFATIPAYLSDVFGSRNVGAVHGRLLTAWSAAGVAGPVLINYLREYQSEHGVPRALAYDLTMWLMAGLLVVGCVCNALVRPVDLSRDGRT